MAEATSCWLCVRPLGRSVEWHHPVPRSRGGRTTVPLHPICHRAVHAHFTNAELAAIGAAVERLRAAPAIAGFLAWIDGKPPDFHAPTRRKGGSRLDPPPFGSTSLRACREGVSRTRAKRRFLDFGSRQARTSARNDGSGCHSTLEIRRMKASRLQPVPSACLRSGRGARSDYSIKTSFSRSPPSRHWDGAPVPTYSWRRRMPGTGSWGRLRSAGRGVPLVSIRRNAPAFPESLRPWD